MTKFNQLFKKTLSTNFTVLPSHARFYDQYLKIVNYLLKLIITK